MRMRSHRQQPLAFFVCIVALTVACGRPAEQAPAPANSEQTTGGTTADRKYLLDTVDDAAVVQLYADGFASLPLREKTLIWHLTQAAIAGRDIYYDQKHRHALAMRGILEAIVTHPQGIDPKTLAAITQYTKLFWINNGPYNNLTARKFVLNTSPEAFADAAKKASQAGAAFPTGEGESLDALLTRLQPMFFDPSVESIVTSKTPGPGKDILTASANNLYSGVSMKDVATFKERYGLNSRLVNEQGRLIEEVYRLNGRYGTQIAGVIKHLEAAIPFAPEATAKALRALIQWYRTGEDADRVKYDIAWVQDKDSSVDTINGFIEVYLDPRGVKGSFEGLVFYVNQEKTARIRKFADNAQWFEDHMPYDAKYRKPNVKGIVANAIEVVVETGDSGPVTPVGINLPNDQRIREEYGSKSVSLSNVREASDNAIPGSMRGEFSWTPEEAERGKKYGSLAGELLTDMHEVIGHASGQQAPGVTRAPQQAIKEHFSALEEGRADLVGLYFTADPKLVELGILTAAEQNDLVLAQYQVVHAKRPGAAAPGSRGHTDRRRPHAQPADGRALADGEHKGDRAAPPRRQNVLRDGGREGLSRGRGPPAHRGAADQVRRGLRRREEAVRHLRHSFRRDGQGSGRGPRRETEAPVLHGLRDAEADTRNGCGRSDHRREDLVSDGPSDPDARMGREEINGVRGCEGARVRRCEGARVRRCEGARVRRCEGARVRGRRRCEGARVRGCEGAKVRGARCEVRGLPRRSRAAAEAGAGACRAVAA